MLARMSRGYCHRGGRIIMNLAPYSGSAAVDNWGKYNGTAEGTRGEQEGKESKKTAQKRNRLN